MPIQRYIRISFGTVLAVSMLHAMPAAAQSQEGGARQVAQEGTTQPGPAKETGAGAQAAPQAAPQPQGAGDAGLKQRIEQLEEQLVDMHVMVGTLESLARGGGSSTSPTAAHGDVSSGSADSLRIDGLETQVRALAAQIEQLSTQVHALGGEGPRSAPVGGAPALPAAPLKQGEAEPSRFGSTTVSAGSGPGDAIGGLIDGEAPKEAPKETPKHDTNTGEAVAAAPPAFMPPPAGGGDPGNPKQLYETAYGYLMQRDYGAAQSSFEDFLNRYPKDSLAGNAQYWLGESHFVRGEYKAAAGAFLKGYQNYAGNARSVDSLLKLAMSLDRLGQKDAACSSFGELTTKFPDAPENVRSRAKSERQRIGCR